MLLSGNPWKISHQQNKADTQSCFYHPDQQHCWTLAQYFVLWFKKKTNKKQQGQCPWIVQTLLKKALASCDMEIKIHNANVHTHAEGGLQHTSLFVETGMHPFVCCFHGNMPPLSVVHRWNGLKSIENSRESYFCSLSTQCGNNKVKLFAVLISFHTWTFSKTEHELSLITVVTDSSKNLKNPLIS